MNFTIPKIDFQIETKCIKCSFGYILNSEWKCDKINCSLISIINNYLEQLLLCRSLCDSYQYKYLEIPYINTTNNNKIEIFDTYDFFFKSPSHLHIFNL